MKSSTQAKLASVTAVLLAIYEAVAIFTGAVPTITDVLEGGPEPVELVVIGGAMLWLAHHFRWTAKFFELLGK